MNDTTVSLTPEEIGPLSQSEVARLLGMPKSTVDTIERRAKEKLRELLIQEFIDLTEKE